MPSFSTKTIQGKNHKSMHLAVEDENKHYFRPLMFAILLGDCNKLSRSCSS
jgi:hypothetical protein